MFPDVATVEYASVMCVEMANVGSFRIPCYRVTTQEHELEKKQRVVTLYQEQGLLRQDHMGLF